MAAIVGQGQQWTVDRQHHRVKVEPVERTAEDLGNVDKVPGDADKARQPFFTCRQLNPDPPSVDG